MGFSAEKTPLSGLLILVPDVFGDERGFFMESYNQRDYAKLGIHTNFVQDNLVRSQKGILRGLHFQKRHPQAKLVQVLRGRVFDVAVDLRKTSPCYGQWYGVYLDNVHHKQLFVPAGFAHGYLTLSDPVMFSYKCSELYHPDDEGGLMWNDPDIGIKWPLDEIGQPLLSDKDKKQPLFRNLGEVFS